MEARRIFDFLEALNYPLYWLGKILFPALVQRTAADQERSRGSNEEMLMKGRQVVQREGVGH